ncbi:hypothetical protein B0H34DRAFT_628033, partial [Crassisporium funariophilum]
LNKSEKAHHDLYNCALAKHFDIILIQEPYTTPKQKYIRPPNRFLSIFPQDRIRHPKNAVRSVIWISSDLATGSWDELPIPGCNDITAVQLKGGFGRITIINIYSDCTNMKTIRQMK